MIKIDYMLVFDGGGGKGAPAAQQPMVSPTAPVEEASVEIGDEDEGANRRATSKQSLKIPLAETVDTGLRV